MSGHEARNEREDLVIPFLLQSASFLPLLIHKSLGASVGRQPVGGSEVEAAAGACCCLHGQRRAAEQAPSYTHRGRLRPRQAFDLCLSQQKERQWKEGKFSPKQQPEGRPLHELGIASGEQAGSPHPRVQTCCVTQPGLTRRCEEERRLPAAVAAAPGAPGATSEGWKGSAPAAQPGETWTQPRSQPQHIIRSLPWRHHPEACTPF